MRSQSYDVDLLLILCPVCSLFTISHDCVMSLNSLPHCYTIISLPFILAFTTRFSHWLRTLSPSRVPLSHYELLISSTSFATSRYHFPDPALVIDSSFRYFVLSDSSSFTVLRIVLFCPLSPPTAACPCQTSLRYCLFC